MKKYIKFEEIPFEGKTKRIEVINIKSGDILGRIQWNTGWRQYTFEPSYPTVWSQDCLADIIQKLEGLNLHRKILKAYDKGIISKKSVVVSKTDSDSFLNFDEENGHDIMDVNPLEGPSY